jgi:hypothetical protein
MSDYTRITGISSGMDTENMIKDLMSAQSTKQDKVEKEQMYEEWRKEVRQYHADRKIGFKIEKGDFILLKKGWSPRVIRICKTSPLRGTDKGTLYRLQKKSFLRKITEEEKAEAKESAIQRLMRIFPEDMAKKIRKTFTNSLFNSDDFEKIIPSTTKKETIVL